MMTKREIIHTVLHAIHLGGEDLDQYDDVVIATLEERLPNVLFIVRRGADRACTSSATRSAALATVISGRKIATKLPIPQTNFTECATTRQSVV